MGNCNATLDGEERGEKWDETGEGSRKRKCICMDAKRCANSGGNVWAGSGFGWSGNPDGLGGGFASSWGHRGFDVNSSSRGYPIQSEH